MKLKQLKDKEEVMYEDDYDPPNWCYHKEDCDYGRNGCKLHTHKFFMKRDVKSSVLWLKKELEDVLCGLDDDIDRVNATIDKAFADIN